MLWRPVSILGLAFMCFSACTYFSLSSSRGMSTRSCVLKCMGVGARCPNRRAQRLDIPSTKCVSHFGCTAAAVAASKSPYGSRRMPSPGMAELGGLPSESSAKAEQARLLAASYTLSIANEMRTFGRGLRKLSTATVEVTINGRTMHLGYTKNVCGYGWGYGLIEGLWTGVTQTCLQLRVWL